MSAPRLWDISDLADEWDVPQAGLRSAAERHGLLIRIGRAVKIADDDIPELLTRCRDQARAHASTGAETGGSSATGASSVQRAREAARKLKKPSPPTSKGAGATVARLHPRTTP